MKLIDGAQLRRVSPQARVKSDLLHELLSSVLGLSRTITIRGCAGYRYRLLHHHLVLTYNLQLAVVQAAG